MYWKVLSNILVSSEEYVHPSGHSCWVTNLTLVELVIW